MNVRGGGVFSSAGLALPVLSGDPKVPQIPRSPRSLSYCLFINYSEREEGEALLINKKREGGGEGEGS